MNLTIKRSNASKNRVTYTSTDLYRFLDMIRDGQYELQVEMFRSARMEVKDEALYVRYDSIPKVIPSAKYTKSAQGEPFFREYNGILTLKVDNLASKGLCDRVKHEASLLPQTLAAFRGANGHSVVILALASLPGQKLPSKENDAALFHTKAYRTAVQCYAPTVSRPITIEEPLLDGWFLMSADHEMYVNERVVPFIIEQPTGAEVMRLVDGRTPENKLVPSGRFDGISMHQVFNACYVRARNEITKEEWKEPMCAVTHIAHECAETGMPEEEAARRILWHYYKEDAQDVRSTVRAVYEGYDPLPELQPGLPKKQIASIRLKEFLQRRYELRHNVVTQNLEYRIRYSLDFQFHPLTKYDRNTIKYEAAMEGIEAFDAEINGFIESNYTPKYNPIEEYLYDLGEWDGVDRIDELAAMVPTDNPHWTRLFRRWFLSMVAHWMDVDHEHGNNTAPILIGKQGYRKSTFCRILLPPELRVFFTDSIDFRTKQEAERYLTRFLLVNIDEFDQLSEAQFAFVKHLFQKPNVSMRRMYSDTIEQQRRYASFIGTSNHEEILRDPTGNRRYLCVQVTEPIHTDTPIDYRQLYAQAVQLIRDGERYWLDDEDEDLLRVTNQQFESQSPLELVLQDVFEPAAVETSDTEWMRLTSLMGKLTQHPSFNRKTMNNLRLLSRIMRKLNYVNKHRKDGTYYLVKKR